ncbi:CAP domain-containing protein [Pimelobacter simplex]|uniref:CAP domain-containing protein n=1 Tax=Nocardioides simplex TaxID=2045 RepID=UPI001932026D|nr:CAP domain-containing protein [Pimelobacter simplex]
MEGLARAVLALVFVATGFVATGPAAVSSAGPERSVRPMSGEYEGAVLKAIERRRSRRDRSGLRASACVDGFAEARSRRMAVRDEMVHYPGLGKVFARCGGDRVGEIIARGRGFRDPVVVVRAWMASPSHHDVIVQPSYREASVGAWRDDAGTVFVSVVFRSP